VTAKRYGGRARDDARLLFYPESAVGAPTFSRCEQSLKTELRQTDIEPGRR